MPPRCWQRATICLEHALGPEVMLSAKHCLTLRRKDSNGVPACRDAGFYVRIDVRTFGEKEGLLVMTEVLHE